MASPITSFIDTLQGKQPLRNAMRGLLGGPRRSSTLIDPMEEMLAREREMGGDVSNPLPQQRRPPVLPVAAQEELPAPSQQLAPPEVIPTPPPVDEKRPYKGMGVMEAMFTPHSMALERQKKQARGAAPGMLAGSPAGLAGSIRTITDDPEMDEVTKLKRLADVTAIAAIEATDNDQRKTLMRVSENFMKRAAYRESADTSRQTVMDALSKQQENIGLQRGLMQDQLASERELLDRSATNTERLNEQIARLARESASRGTAFSDEIAPLMQDRGMPVEIYARQMQAAAAARNREKGVPEGRHPVQRGGHLRRRTHRLDPRTKAGSRRISRAAESFPIGAYECLSSPHSSAAWPTTAPNRSGSTSEAKTPTASTLARSWTSARASTWAMPATK